MVHEGVKNFQCEHCNKAYYTLRLLKRHIGMQHDDGTNQFRCDKCPRTFPELNILKLLTLETYKRTVYNFGSALDGDAGQLQLGVRYGGEKGVHPPLDKR